MENKTEGNSQAIHGRNGEENTRRSDRGFFEIRIAGHLDDSWSDWLEGLVMKTADNGETVLLGRIRDQAALLGVLNRIYGLNLRLLSVREIDPQE
jgi:hypothetical protein